MTLTLNGIAIPLDIIYGIGEKRRIEWHWRVLAVNVDGYITVNGTSPVSIAFARAMLIIHVWLSSIVRNKK